MKNLGNLGQYVAGAAVLGGLGLMGKKWYDMKKAQAQVAPPAPAPVANVGPAPAAPPAAPAKKA